MSALGIGGEQLWLCPTLDNAGAGTTTVNNLGNPAINNGLLSSSALWVNDGDNRYINISAVGQLIVGHSAGLAIPNTYTFGAWVWRASFGHNFVYCAKDSDSPRVLPMISSSVGGIYTQRSTTTNQFQGAGSVPALSNSVWHHVMFRLVNTSGNNFAFTAFLDGVSVQSGTFTGTLADTISPLRFSALSGATPQSHRLDDYRLFYRGLSNAEVALLASRRGYQPLSSRRRRELSGAGL